MVVCKRGINFRSPVHASDKFTKHWDILMKLGTWIPLIGSADEQNRSTLTKRIDRKIMKRYK